MSTTDKLAQALLPSGRTTRQITNAPPGSVFVWCNSNLVYPLALAKALGRDDLVVRPVSWLTRHNVAGRNFCGVVVDHAARLNTDALDALRYMRLRMKPKGGEA